MIDNGELAAVLQQKAEALQVELLAKVESNLSGDVLQERSGALKNSIVASLDAQGDAVEVGIDSFGVPYAEIQEYGGQTAAHEIVPVKARALAFAGAGGLVFARRVDHPGSTLPARPYMASALDSLAPTIVGGLKQAVCDALGAQ